MYELARLLFGPRIAEFASYGGERSVRHSRGSVVRGIADGLGRLRAPPCPRRADRGVIGFAPAAGARGQPLKLIHR
jgi:hypothetical protein